MGKQEVLHILSVCACVRVRARACVRACVRACSFSYPACKACVPRYIGTCGFTTFFYVVLL